MKGNLRKSLMTLSFLILAACSNSEEAISDDHSTLLREETKIANEDLIIEEQTIVEEIETEADNFEKLEALSDESAVEDDYQGNISNKVNEEADILTDYTSEEIEYARIWLQLGPNQEIDELYVTRIPEGELVNKNDESSASYPEAVVQLAGSRLVDGSVTYSSNGDGTINVYHVPIRWETNTPEDFNSEDLKIFTESIVNNTELVYVNPGNDEDVISFIEKIKN